MFYAITSLGNIGPFKTYRSAQSWLKTTKVSGTICNLIDPAFAASTLQPAAEEQGSNTKEPSLASSSTTDATKRSPK